MSKKDINVLIIFMIPSSFIFFYIHFRIKVNRQKTMYGNLFTSDLAKNWAISNSYLWKMTFLYSTLTLDILNN